MLWLNQYQKYSTMSKKFLPAYFLLVRLPILLLSGGFLFRHEFKAAMGAGSKRTKATNGATLERPLAKDFAAMPPKSIEGSMNLRATNAIPATKTLSHQGYSTSRLSIDSSFRPIKFLTLITVITVYFPLFFAKAFGKRFFADFHLFPDLEISGSTGMAALLSGADWRDLFRFLLSPQSTQRTRRFLYCLLKEKKNFRCLHHR